MMLSDQDIQAELAKGGLVIDPLAPQAIRPAGITLHLGLKLLKPQEGICVDVLKNVLPQHEEIALSMENPYALQPGGFVLGATFEKVTVGNHLGFLIEGRSTLARVGLTIVQTAMLVYPGHRGRSVTLELANHGPNPILLYPKMKIARAAIFELKTAAVEGYDDSGKYAEQKEVGPAIFKREFLE